MEQISIFDMGKEKNKKHKIACFTGHRPDKLGGYDNSTKIEDEYNIMISGGCIFSKIKLLREKIKEEIINLIINENVDTFISGGALGIDQICFYIVNELKETYPHIKNVIAVPTDKQSKNWFGVTKRKYSYMLSLADEIINVYEIDEYKIKPCGIEKIDGTNCLSKRNHYMVDSSDFVIAVWNGDIKGGTYSCVKYATKKEGKIIIQINPYLFNSIKVNNKTT